MREKESWSPDEIQRLADWQDGTTHRHFPKRRNDWVAVADRIGGEAALDRLSDQEAEYLRLVYGLSRPQLSMQNAAHVVTGNSYHPKWGNYNHARTLLAKLLIERKTCPTCGGTGEIATVA